MPSPFPGMNPYLEHRTVWHDFHEAFLPAIREELSRQVRPNFFVRIDEHVYIHEMPEGDMRFRGRGDVTIHRRPLFDDGGIATTVIEAPEQVELPMIDLEHVSFLEICDREEQRVVTVIEVLSPSNKRSGPDREQYIAKRNGLIYAYINLVELDLLRGGPRMPMNTLPECDYYAMVSRWKARPQADIWPIRLRDPLPTIPIPLDGPHPDAKLDLQAVLHRVFDGAGYEDYIYNNLPEPPLNAVDQQWADSILGK